MRAKLLLAIAVSAAAFLPANPSAAQTDISQVDFKNFSYPWSGSLRDKPGWLDISHARLVRLTNGRRLHNPGPGNGVMREGLTLEEVQYADVTGDGQTDAVVALRYDTGGTMFFYFVYVYSFAAAQPKLLACFQSGERADSGLYRVYGQDGKLVVELFDSKKQVGECCSTRFVRTRYIWRDGKFLADGVKEFGTPKTTSRLPVSIMGIHQQ
ncbi:MAG: hypothetical protein ABR912_08310 [Terracidiphilus sp.]|jgi:hypothetical protein